MPEFIKLDDLQCHVAQFNKHTKNTNYLFYKYILYVI